VLQTNQGRGMDYVLGIKRVIWPLSIFASAERLSSDEKSSVTNEGAVVLDCTEERSFGWLPASTFTT
jgi:hypothetical protein